MSTKAQIKTQAKTPAAPVAAHIPQPPVAEPEHVAQRPDIAAQLEGAARLGHSLGAVGVDRFAPPIIQRQEIPEEEEEELQMKREPAVLQRQELPEEEEELQMKPESAAPQRQELPEEELMMKPDIQRVGPQGGPVPPEVEAAIQRAWGGGQPLDRALQNQMSEALGHDFSKVRVHTDSEADELNQQLSAQAFTTGPDIFFGRGAYAPYSSGGRELIAHELSHVVQQSSGRQNGGGRGLTARPSGDASEDEAEALGRRAERNSTNRPEQKAVANPAMAAPADILALQRTAGNWAVQGWLKQRSLGSGQCGESLKNEEISRPDGDGSDQLRSLTPLGVTAPSNEVRLNKNVVQRMPLTEKGEAAKKFDAKKKGELATELMNGTKVMDYAGGVCYDAVAFVKYLQGKIDDKQLVGTSGQDWLTVFNFEGGTKWDGGAIPAGTAVGFKRLRDKKFFHAALAVGGTNVRGVNGLMLGAGWIDRPDLKKELKSSGDGNYIYDNEPTEVWLSKL